ncbi:protein PLANT CADMIUM RESISTANCE 6-like [Rhodamnia argentea]|uniref:Protein PLANT CADMIUM RESISTANCE 6-like n=1 Tax=Rhodamnia argentea TaxID=178133 RepID=A0A8B8P8E1_9MYRT|nr:protein PLANT CADMIUM RESISTANCE 6-like [Rhodamnia argentea]
MGNPQADSSDIYQQDQADYNVQIQYNVQVSYDDNSNDPAYYNPNPQGDPSYQPLQSDDGGGGGGPDPQYHQDDAANNHQQQQQEHFQPPLQQQQQKKQQFQPPQHQQHQQQQLEPPQLQQQFGPSLPQFNQPYAAALPPRPVAQFPPQSPQMNPAYANQGAYPPQQQPSYPTATGAPQQYPSQQQPQYAQQSVPQAYPPNSPPPKPYPPSPAYQQQPAAQPVQFPPPAGGVAQYAAMPPSPIKPGVQGYNGAAQGIPMQPNMMGSVNTEGWRTGLFDCMDDPMNTAITFFFPCLTFGQVAEITDNGTTSCAMGALMYGLIGAFIGMPCIYSCMYRSKLRNKFGLVESPAPDWIVHCLCEPCALCQEYRELNRRGWDPSIGWLGNVQKQQRMQQQPQVAMVPPMNQTMMA